MTCFFNRSPKTALWLEKPPLHPQRHGPAAQHPGPCQQNAQQRGYQGGLLCHPGPLPYGAPRLLRKGAPVPLPLPPQAQTRRAGDRFHHHRVAALVGHDCILAAQAARLAVRVETGFPALLHPGEGGIVVRAAAVGNRLAVWDSRNTKTRGPVPDNPLFDGIGLEHGRLIWDSSCPMNCRNAQNF